jgi:hypothetical protein
VHVVLASLAPQLLHLEDLVPADSSTGAAPRHAHPALPKALPAFFAPCRALAMLYVYMLHLHSFGVLLRVTEALPKLTSLYCMSVTWKNFPNVTPRSRSRWHSRLQTVQVGVPQGFWPFVWPFTVPAASGRTHTEADRHDSSEWRPLVLDPTDANAVVNTTQCVLQDSTLYTGKINLERLDKATGETLLILSVFATQS